MIKKLEALYLGPGSEEFLDACLEIYGHTYSFFLVTSLEDSIFRCLCPSNRANLVVSVLLSLFLFVCLLSLAIPSLHAHVVLVNPNCQQGLAIAWVTKQEIQHVIHAHCQNSIARRYAYHCQ